MTDHPPHTEPPRYWSQSAPASRWSQTDTPLRRFIGGSPLAVLVKLIVVSLLVGVLLMWNHVTPAAVYRLMSNIVDWILTLGFRSIQEFGSYIVAGAVIVIPIWLILRVLSYRGR